MKLAEGNRVLWLEPETNREIKATIERVYKIKARITLSDLSTRSVPLSELELAPLPCRTIKQAESERERQERWMGKRVQWLSKIGTVIKVISLSSVRVLWDDGETEVCLEGWLKVVDESSISSESSITPPVIEPLTPDDREKSSITPPVIEPLAEDDSEKSSITPPVIEPLTPDDREKSSITPPVIELSDSIPEKSSITPPVIELSDSIPEKSSITPPVIEPLGFNVYTKLKKGKPYKYWRYSYRLGKVTHHIHIGKIDRVLELQGKPRSVVLAALGRGKG